MVDASTRWLPRTVIVCATAAAARSAVTAETMPASDGSASARNSTSDALRARKDSDFIVKKCKPRQSRQRVQKEDSPLAPRESNNCRVFHTSQAARKTWPTFKGRRCARDTLSNGFSQSAQADNAALSRRIRPNPATLLAGAGNAVPDRGDVVAGGEDHQRQDRGKTDAEPDLLRALAERPAANRLDREEQEI